MRLIDADALNVKQWFASTDNRKRMAEALDAAPTIDAEPVRHGRWIEANKTGWVDGQYYATPRLVCPFCIREAAHYSVEHAEHGGSVTELYWIRTDCCPHCGAKMDKKEVTE